MLLPWQGMPGQGMAQHGIAWQGRAGRGIGGWHGGACWGVACHEGAWRGCACLATPHKRTQSDQPPLHHRTRPMRRLACISTPPAAWSPLGWPSMIPCSTSVHPWPRWRCAALLPPCALRSSTPAAAAAPAATAAPPHARPMPCNLMPCHSMAVGCARQARLPSWDPAAAHAMLHGKRVS